MKKLLILSLFILVSCSISEADIQEVPTCVPLCIPYSSPTPTSTHTPTPTLTPTPPPICPVGCVTEMPTPDTSSLPIIPGVSGFGITTPAGSGRNLSSPQTTVFKVVNLDASGTGSLTECVRAIGPRVCVFEVAGTIQLTSDLNIGNPYITIAGQTSPSPGITLRGAGLRITTHDVLLQHIRIRVGDDLDGPNPENRDGLSIYGTSGVYNIVVDHVSVSWAVDENLTLWYDGVQDVTIMNSIISEALHDSIHPKGIHSNGLLLGGIDNAGPSRISIFQNLFAHNNERNIQYSGDQNSSVFFANNLIYNWGTYATRFRYSGETSAVGNTYISGINSNSLALIILDGGGYQVYLNDIMVDDYTPSDAWDIINGDSSPRVNIPPIWANGFVAMNSALVEDYVLNNVGSRPADRDSVDIRVVQSVRDRTGRIINSQSEVGGWPNPPGVILNTRILTIPTNPNDDSNGDGYTNLEEWLHEFANQVES